MSTWELAMRVELGNLTQLQRWQPPNHDNKLF